MNTMIAKQIARNLMNEHGVGHLEFGFNKRKRSLGICRFRFGEPVRIELSHHWVNALPEEHVTDTILHEIAHALAGIKAGHGPEWKAWARKIGANPNRVADGEVIQQAAGKVGHKYTATCDTCGAQGHFSRMGKKWQNNQYYCPCSKDSKLTITQNY